MVFIVQERKPFITTYTLGAALDDFHSIAAHASGLEREREFSFQDSSTKNKNLFYCRKFGFVSYEQMRIDFHLAT